MNITNAQYTTDDDGNNEFIKCDVDNVSMFVPIKEGNRHYAEIMRQVEEGTLTIAEPDA